MTLIENMSETERQSWITLMVDVAVFITFLKAMMTGLSIDTLSASELSRLAISLCVIMVVLYIIIQSVFAIRTRDHEREPKDERDIRIERKGATYGFYAISLLIWILVGHVVIQNGLDSIPEISENHQTVFDYTNTSHLVFALICVGFVGDIVKNAVMLLAYRQF